MWDSPFCFTHTIKTESSFGHWLTVHKLPPIKEGEYEQYCLYDWNLPIFIYDDDAPSCICDEGEECDFDWGPALDCGYDPVNQSACECGAFDCVKQGRKHREHMQTTEAICYAMYPHDDRIMFQRECITVPHDTMSAFPGDFHFPELPHPSRRGGYIYAVASQPDLSLHRLKFGWTTDVRQRLASFKTLCPRALLLGLWEADECDEAWIFALIVKEQDTQQSWGQRFLESEEFDVYEPFKLLKAISILLPQHQEQTREYRHQPTLPPSND